MSYLIAALPSLRSILLQDCFLDAAVLLKFGTGWPQLGYITLNNKQLDAESILALTQAKSPHLRHLDLSLNDVDTAGMQSLLSCSWPAGSES